MPRDKVNAQPPDPPNPPVSMSPDDPTAVPHQHMEESHDHHD